MRARALDASSDDLAASADARVSYVLIAESDLVRSASLLEALEPLRIGALVARDGDEALQVLERFGSPSLLAISLALPRRDALAVMTALRSVAGPQRAGIIALAPLHDLGRLSSSARRHLGISSVLQQTVGAAAFRAAAEKALAAAGIRPAMDSDGAPSSAHDLVEELLRDMTGRAARISGAAGCVVYLQIEGLERFRAHVDWISDRDVESLFALPYAYDWISRTGEVLAIPDIAAQPLFGQHTETLEDVVRSLIAVPLVGEEKAVIGALCVFDTKPLDVTTAQIDALKELGREYGAVLEHEAAEVTVRAQTARNPEAEAPVASTISADAVTGLLTRESGCAFLVYEAARADDQGQPIGLILIALDRLAGVDALRQDAARDRVLRSVSQTIKSMLRASDVAVRWAADEFLVVLPTIGISTARDVAERIREAAQRIDPPEMASITVSGGVTELPPGSSQEAAVRRLEQQVAVARERGGNRIE